MDDICQNIAYSVFRFIPLSTKQFGKVDYFLKYFPIDKTRPEKTV